MKKLKHQPQIGFTLIEAMIAAFVVAIGLLGLAKLQSGFFAGNGESRTQTAALHFAQQKIESFRFFSSQSDFDRRLVSGADACDPAEADSSCAGINATLNRRWEVSDCPNAVHCRQVTLTVTWTDPEGLSKNTTLTSFIAATEPVDAGVAIAD
jgi:Tfp pilus assembly protein PilV